MAELEIVQGVSIMTISARYFPESIYLIELDLQCHLALQSVNVLRIGIEDWKQGENREPIQFSALLNKSGQPIHFSLMLFVRVG